MSLICNKYFVFDLCIGSDWGWTIVVITLPHFDYAVLSVLAKIIDLESEEVGSW